MSLELYLWGPVLVLLDGKPIALPTRKLLALIAYLSIEGPTSRNQLATLLWEADEERAKGNLRGELYRLRKTPLAEAIEDINGQLGLREFSSDLQGFSNSSLPESALSLRRGLLLENLELLDAPAFEEWLQLSRERWEESYNRVLLSHAEQLTQTGNLNRALEAYQQLLTRDPLREEGVRGSMALLAQQGEAAKALEHYQRHAAFLERELGLAPSKETRALAETLRAGHAVVPLSQSVQSVQLAGRRQEWEQIAQAWQSGQMVFVRGEPGVGKSRLMLEFLKGQSPSPALLLGRPGDAQVPFASITRLLRQVIETSPSLASWVQRELSRLLPELGHEPLQQQSPEDRIRLFEAIAAALKGQLYGGDDLQFVDGASLEVLDFLMGQLEQPLLLAYRKGELSASAEALVQNQLAAGRAVLLDLEPLEALALEEMLAQIQLAGPVQHLSQSLHRLTGGNPLFVLETLKSLSEQGQLGITAEAFEQAWKNLPRPQKVHGLIAQRLERLSPPARELLRFAAIAGQSFTLRLAQSVLGHSPLAIAETSDALEHLGMLRAGRFAHDLLYEATLETIPAPSRKLLHGEVLKALQDALVPAAVLAAHALGSGEPRAILEHCHKAGSEARQLAAWPQALEQLGHALEVLQDLPNPEQEAWIRLEREEIFSQTANRAAQARELEHLTALLASVPAIASELAYRKGRWADVGGEFEQAAQWYQQSRTQAAKLALVYVLENLGTLEGAREAALEVYHHPENSDQALKAALLLAELGFEHGDPAAATEWYGRAEGLAGGNPVRQVRLSRSKGRFFYHTGDLKSAILEMEHGIALARELMLPADEASLLHNLGAALNSAHRTVEALDCFIHSEALAKKLKMPFLEQSAQTQQGVLRIHLGEFAQATELISGNLAYHKMVLASALLHLGDLLQARANAQAAMAEFKPHIWLEREAHYVLALLETRTGNHAQSERLLRQTLEVSEPTLNELSQSLLAFNLLVQGRAQEALEVSNQAYVRYPDIAVDLPVQQVAWVQAQILKRLGRTEEALQALAQAHTVMRAFMEQLKPEQQKVYMEAFAYNGAIEDAVKGKWPEKAVLL